MCRVELPAKRVGICVIPQVGEISGKERDEVRTELIKHSQIHMKKIQGIFKHHKKYEVTVPSQSVLQLKDIWSYITNDISAHESRMITSMNNINHENLD